MVRGIELNGRVESVRVTRDGESLVSTEVEKIMVVCNQGIKGDRHYGRRLIDSRENGMLEFGFMKGMEIANLRQWSAISSEELDQIRQALAVPEPMPFGLLGENLVISGIPNFTKLPLGTMLFFQKNKNNKRSAVLFVSGDNYPCIGPGLVIEKYFKKPKLASRFPKVANGRRGLVGIVYSTGYIGRGDNVIVKIPLSS